jgi:hypothetical protein
MVLLVEEVGRVLRYRRQTVNRKVRRAAITRSGRRIVIFRPERHAIADDPDSFCILRFMRRDASPRRAARDDPLQWRGRQHHRSVSGIQQRWLKHPSPAFAPASSTLTARCSILHRRLRAATICSATKPAVSLQMARQAAAIQLVARLSRTHADFWQVTGEALDFALETLGVSVAAMRDRLMRPTLSSTLSPRFRRYRGIFNESDWWQQSCRIGRRKMLQAVVDNASLANLLDGVYSVEEVGV